jgi:hypothetical protein
MIHQMLVEPGDVVARLCVFCVLAHSDGQLAVRVVCGLWVRNNISLMSTAELRTHSPVFMSKRYCKWSSVC